MYTRILVPTDGSEITERAMQHAFALARTFQAQLVVLAVREPFPLSAISEMQPTPPQVFFDAQMRTAEAHLQRAASLATATTAGLAIQPLTVEADHPWQAIVDTAADQRCDLIVMASHGRRGVSALLLGSETQKVLTHSKVPVLVVR
jgi:nucleotide-binding universal stress UspA family protein